MNYNEKMLKSALWYHDHGFCVFPASKYKTPFKNFPLETYLYKKPTKEQVKLWWSEVYPGANIASSMGEISGMTVFDLDLYDMTDEMKNEALKLFKDIAAPTAQSPRGGLHLYFQYHKDVPSKAGVLKGFERIDAKNTGGYIMLPPSIGENGDGKDGNYTWVKDKHIKDIPLSLVSNTIKSLLYNTIYTSKEGQQLPTIANMSNMVNFNEGGRDQTLFHLANTLMKGGMTSEEIEQYLLFVASNCNPPFPEKEVKMKILSALKRGEGKITNLTSELREMISANMGATINLQYAYNCQHVQHKEDKKKIQTIFGRFVKEGLVERTGRVAGEYRVLDYQCKPTDFRAKYAGGIDIRYPLGADRFFHTMPKNIIVFTGVKETGKTAIALNIIKLNQNRESALPIKYFSNEFGGAELQDRLLNFDMPLNDWNFDFYERANNYGDVIGKDHINIIDYLELLDNFYLVGKKISEIWEKLDQGVAIIFLQKDKGKEIARGGHTSLDRARAYFVIDPDFPGQTIRVETMKNWRDPLLNPKGYKRNYKIVKGCKLIEESDWYLE